MERNAVYIIVYFKPLSAALDSSSVWRGSDPWIFKPRGVMLIRNRLLVCRRFVTSTGGRTFLPPKQGLYDPSAEKDSCGVGFVVDIQGIRTHTVVEQALE